MKRQIGLWIDHKKAIIVTIVGEGEGMKQVQSNAERRIRPKAGSRAKTPRGPLDVSSDDKRDRQFQGHLNRFYDEVIAHISGADDVLIFGPGEAKEELRKRIRSKQLRDRVVGVETVDKLTDRQIAARVRRHFAK